MAERSACVRIKDAVDSAIEEIRSRNRDREVPGLAEATTRNRERLETCLAAADLAFSMPQGQGGTRSVIMRTLPPPAPAPSSPAPSPSRMAPAL